MKSVLVIDTPNTCEDCHLRLALDRYRCINTKENRLRWCGDEDGFYTSDTKPSWCPLRPLPNKLNVKAEKIEDIMHTSLMTDKFIAEIKIETGKVFALGWNACLEEITGETK